MSLAHIKNEMWNTTKMRECTFEIWSVLAKMPITRIFGFFPTLSPTPDTEFLQQPERRASEHIIITSPLQILSLFGDPNWGGKVPSKSASSIPFPFSMLLLLLLHCSLLCKRFATLLYLWWTPPELLINLPEQFGNDRRLSNENYAYFQFDVL